MEVYILKFVMACILVGVCSVLNLKSSGFTKVFSFFGLLASICAMFYIFYQVVSDGDL